MTSSSEQDSTRPEASSEPDSSDVEVAPVEPSHAQRAISALLALQVPPGQLPLEALVALKHLEQIQASSNVLSERFGGYCFDAVNVPALWSATQLCQRCVAFNQLLQASRADTSSTIASGILETCSRATSCITAGSSERDTRRDASLPRLPWELLEVVIDCAIDEMENTQQHGSAVAALMHTSSSIRFRIAKAFSPIRLYQGEAPQAYVPDELLSILAPTIRWSLSDISFQVRGTQPACPMEFLRIDDDVSFSEGLSAFDGMVRVRFFSETALRETGRDVALAERTQRHRQDPELSVRDIGGMFIDTIKNLRNGLGEEHGCLPPRALNLHQRALVHNRLGDPVEGIIIEISMTGLHEWRWEFVTKCLDDKTFYS